MGTAGVVPGFSQSIAQSHSENLFPFMAQGPWATCHFNKLTGDLDILFDPFLFPVPNPAQYQICFFSLLKKKKKKLLALYLAFTCLLKI